MKKKILLAGGSGLIGKRMVEYFNTDKYEFHILSRKQRKGGENYKYFIWDTDVQSIDKAALKEVDVIINLAGAGIADKRWTEARKKEILSSRVNSIETIEKYLSEMKSYMIYIGASAIGYYGDQGDRKLTEKDDSGSGFLAEVTEAWEKAHLTIKTKFKRQILFRIGIVLSSNGGALKEIMKPAAAGVYGYFGNGSAYYSWVHIDDICKMIQESIENESYDGIYNATAEDPVPIKSLVAAVKKAKSGSGLLLPVPEFALKLALGQMEEMLTNSTRVIPQKLMDENYEFIFPDSPEKAIKDILEKKI